MKEALIRTLFETNNALIKAQNTSSMTLFDGKEFRVITPEESREHFSVMIKEEKHNEKVMQEVKWRLRARGFKVA